MTIEEGVEDRHQALALSYYYKGEPVDDVRNSRGVKEGAVVRLNPQQTSHYRRLLQLDLWDTWD